MKNENSNEKLLNAIDDAIADTYYIKDEATPYRGIFKVLSRWLIIYTITSLILYIHNLMGLHLMMYNYEWYFIISRLTALIMFPVSLIVYFLLLIKTKMTLKEKDFLKTYSSIVILLVFSRIIYPLSYYLDSEILIGLYQTISLDLAVLILSSFFFNYYFKNNLTKNLIIFNIIIFIINIALFSIYVTTDSPSSMLIFMQNGITELRDHGVFVIINFAIMLYYMHSRSKQQ